MWNLDTEGKPDPWRADDYLFGVWDLLSGREAEGYARLEECVKKLWFYERPFKGISKRLQ